jgi:hypothetical protein
MASGPWGQRGLKIAFERLAQKAGERVAASDAAKSLYERLVREMPALGTTGVFEGTNILLQVATQDLVFWRVIGRLFRLSDDQARELGNEAFDSFWGGLFDAINRHREKPPKEAGRALERDVDELIEKMRGDIGAKNPALVNRVKLVHGHIRLYHRADCREVARLGTGTEMTEFEALNMGGRRTRECPGCSDLNAEFSGTFGEALAKCDHRTRKVLNDLLASEALKAHRHQLLTAGQKRRDITVAMLNEVAESTPLVAVDKLAAMMGVTLGKKSPVDTFIDRAKKLGEKILDNNSVERKQFRGNITNANKTSQEMSKLLRGKR